MRKYLTCPFGHRCASFVAQGSSVGIFEVPESAVLLLLLRFRAGGEDILIGLRISPGSGKPEFNARMIFLLEGYLMGLG